MRMQRGFTLIELMVAVLVATILISIAVPAYKTQIRKSRRTDAKTALLDLAGREERYFNTNNTYTAVSGNLGYGTATTAMSAFPVGSGYYGVTITPTATPSTTYLIVAIPLTADQLKDTSCLYFSVSNTGQQTANMLTTGAGTDSTATCW